MMFSFHQIRLKFNYKSAFQLALFSNILLLTLGTTLIAKSPSEAVPRLVSVKNPKGNASKELYMQTGEAVYIHCMEAGVDKGDLDITQGRQARLLFCTPSK